MSFTGSCFFIQEGDREGCLLLPILPRKFFVAVECIRVKLGEFPVVTASSREASPLEACVQDIYIAAFFKATGIERWIN